MKKILLAVAALVSLASCHFKKELYLDFTNLDLGPDAFKATYVKSGPLTKSMIEDAVLPDGSTVGEYEQQTKASSTTAVNMLQQFLKWEKQDEIIEIAGVYKSVDTNGDPIVLSGKVVLPADGRIKRIILVSHYTIGANYEAPSNTFPLEAQLASMGYAMIFPDYIGYGITVDRPHPYLMMETTATNVLDMYRAVKPFLKAIGREPEHPDIYLMGYSQGGGTTLAVMRMIEDFYSDEVKIKRVFAGGGIYDVKYTYDHFIETNWASYPCGVPFVLYGQVKGFGLDDSFLEMMLMPVVYDHLDEFFVQKKLSTKQMNGIIGTHVTSEILTETAMDRVGYEVSTLYSMMTLNSVLSYSWYPEAPIYMMHSIDDDTVPYGNATRAKSRWPEANIQYNFGHYGNHVMCCLRFIFTVKTLLEEAGE